MKPELLNHKPAYKEKEKDNPIFSSGPLDITPYQSKGIKRYLLTVAPKIVAYRASMGSVFRKVDWKLWFSILILSSGAVTVLIGVYTLLMMINWALVGKMLVYGLVMLLSCIFVFCLSQIRARPTHQGYRREAGPKVTVRETWIYIRETIIH